MGGGGLIGGGISQRSWNLIEFYPYGNCTPNNLGLLLESKRINLKLESDRAFRGWGRVMKSTGISNRGSTTLQVLSRLLTWPLNGGLWAMVFDFYLKKMTLFEKKTSNKKYCTEYSGINAVSLPFSLLLVWPRETHWAAGQGCLLVEGSLCPQTQA